MTTSIRILTTSTLDSTPSILLISPNGSKTLLNCGEGCQRSFLESNGLRIKSVNRICLTHLSHDSVGGLPGTILTTADATQAAAANEGVKNMGNMKFMGAKMLNLEAKDEEWKRQKQQQQQQIKKQQQQQHNDAVNPSSPGAGATILPDLELIGPVGTKAFHHSLRHFMRRDRFHIDIHEGLYLSPNYNDVHQQPQQPPRGLGKRNKKNKKKKQAESCGISSSTWEGFIVESVPMSMQSSFQSQPYTQQQSPRSIPISSYIFKTPPIPGKFMPDKAKALGIPPGPLYGQLKNGKAVTFTTKEEGIAKTVQPHEVVTEGQPAAVVIVVYCPNMEVLDTLKNTASFSKFYDQTDSTKGENGDNANEKKKNKEEDAVLDVIMHLTTKHVFNHEKYQSWMRRFGNSVEHLLLHTNHDCFSPLSPSQQQRSSANEVNVNSEEIVDTEGSPFQSATNGALCRSFLNEDIYPSPFDPRLTELILADYHDDKEEDVKMKDTSDGIIDENGNGAEESKTKDCVGTMNDGTNSQNDNLKIIHGKPSMEYILIPRSRKGINPESVNQQDDKDDDYKSDYGITKKESMGIYKESLESGAIELAKEITSSLSLLENDNSKTPSLTEEVKNNKRDSKLGELIFTGTGSALPCKHRNVTGMYLRMDNGNAIMLDVGEGTTGLLLRSWKHTVATRHCCKDNIDKDSDKGSFMDEFRQRIRGIKAVWISHPHADHHLGLLRLLAERNALCSSAGANGNVGGANNDPLVLIAPPSMFRFLSEYSIVDPSIAGSYIPLDCQDILPVEQRDRNNTSGGHNANQQFRQRHPLLDKLKHDLGVTNCVSVPVAHCPHSYAVVIDGTSFGRVAYSGDCRPSDRFANVGYGADLLIHESTFENGMEEEALLKRHCTVGEALSVGKKMSAKSVVLTHFSQRYPRIPPLNSSFGVGSADVMMGRSISDESCSKRQKTGEYAMEEKWSQVNDDGCDYNHDKTKVAPLQSSSDNDVPVVFAFDFMTLKPSNVKLASKLTTAVRLLYPDDDMKNADANQDNSLVDTFDVSSESLPSAKEILSVPGAFAAKGVL